jgi:hypothetical protein
MTTVINVNRNGEPLCIEIGEGFIRVTNSDTGVLHVERPIFGYEWALTAAREEGRSEGIEEAREALAQVWDMESAADALIWLLADKEPT